MTIPITIVANSQTFGTWLTRTNDVCTIISQNAVTVDATSTGSVSTGNGFVNGSFGSIILFTDDINGNVIITSTGVNTSWGFSANSTQLKYSKDLFSNNLYIGSNINICNSSGLYVYGGLYSNTLTISNYFSVNATSSYSNNLIVNGYTNVITLSAQSSINIGLVLANTSALSVNQAIINSSSFIIGSNVSIVSPLLRLANSSGNINLTATNMSTSWGLSSNSTSLYSNNISANASSIGSVTSNSSGLYGSNLYSNNISANVSSIGSVTSNSSGLYGSNLYSNNISANAVSVSPTTINSTGFYTNSIFISNVSSGSFINVGITIVNTSGLFSSNVVVGNIITNSSGLYCNTTITSNNISIGSANIIGNTTGLYANLFTINVISAGPTTINSSGLYATSLTVNNTLGIIGGSNSAVNTTINASSLWMGNSSSIFIAGNSSGIYTNSNITVTGNLFVTGNITSTGTSVANGNFIPLSNSYSLGNSSGVWILWASTINASSNSIFQANLIVNGSIIIGNSSVNSTVTSTTYSGTSNNTSYVGSVIAANVVSNGQLSSNLANYQTTAGLNGNIASYLPNYTGVLNTSSISIGTTTVNVSINSTSILLTNSSSNVTLSVPTALQISNSQYYFNANGSWVYSPVSNGGFTGNMLGATTIDYYSMTNYKGAKYIVSCIDNNANNRYFTELLTTHDTSSGYITEYGMITTNSIIGLFSVSTNTSFVLLQFTSSSSSNVTILFDKIII